MNSNFHKIYLIICNFHKIYLIICNFHKIYLIICNFYINGAIVLVIVDRYSIRFWFICNNGYIIFG